MGNAPVVPAPHESTNLVPAIQSELKVTVHSNVAQDIIMITEDRTYKCLRIWSDGIAERNSWIAPISLIVPLVFTFITTDFKDAFGVSKDTWRAVAIIAIVIAALWTFKELVKLAQHHDGPTVDDLIQELKRGAIVKRMDKAELANHLDRIS
jgi:hypothetical protein